MEAILKNYWPIGIFILFLAYRYFKSKKMKALIPELKQKGAIIVDVRSAAEFQSAHNPESINIPLNTLNSRSGELDKEKPILLCCASGARSGMARSILKSQGFKEVYNIGSWVNA
jgi:phage shock protein E